MNFPREEVVLVGKHISRVSALAAFTFALLEAVGIGRVNKVLMKTANWALGKLLSLREKETPGRGDSPAGSMLVDHAKGWEFSPQNQRKRWPL